MQADQALSSHHYIVVLCWFSLSQPFLGAMIATVATDSICKSGGFWCWKVISLRLQVLRRWPHSFEVHGGLCFHNIRFLVADSMGKRTRASAAQFQLLIRNKHPPFKTTSHLHYWTGISQYLLVLREEGSPTLLLLHTAQLGGRTLEVP